MSELNRIVGYPACQRTGQCGGKNIYIFGLQSVVNMVVLWRVKENSEFLPDSDNPISED